MAVPKQGLPYFIINAKALETGRKDVPEIVKMQVLRDRRRYGIGWLASRAGSKISSIAI